MRRKSVLIEKYTYFCSHLLSEQGMQNSCSLALKPAVIFRLSNDVNDVNVFDKVKEDI